MAQPVRDLAIALEAALRWQYKADTLDHIKKGVPQNKNFDAAYIKDVASMRIGCRVVEDELGIDLIAVIKARK